MARVKVDTKPNKFNEIFSSANRFVVRKKADNPFLRTRAARVVIAKKSAIREQESSAAVLAAKK
jgi:hypothetical protein